MAARTEKGEYAEFAHPRSPAGTPERHHAVSPMATDQRLNVASPPLQPGSLFDRVFRPIICPGYAGFVAGDVVNDRLDHVRRDTDLGHAGDGTAA